MNAHVRNDSPVFDRAALAAHGLAPSDFNSLSVYQDVVLNGQVALQGVRDCELRWRLMAPHLPSRGAVLDAGSNFGWFGLRTIRHSSELVVASVEADHRSAAVQRKVLASHADRRICLLNRRAGLSQLQSFAKAGQHFSAAFCLSVLHWMPEHRQFLKQLGTMCDRIFLELPDSREVGSGDPKICREIGSARAYLSTLFPDRQIERLGLTPNHRFEALPREMWLVEPSQSVGNTASTGLDAISAIENDLSWPPRSWWQTQLNSVTPNRKRIELGPQGLAGTGDGMKALHSAIARIPELGLNTRSQRWRRRAFALAKRAGIISPV